MFKKYVVCLLLTLIPLTANAGDWMFNCLMRDYVKDLGKGELVHMPTPSFTMKIKEQSNELALVGIDSLSASVMKITEKSNSDFWAEGLIKIEARNRQLSLFFTNSFLVFVNANPFEPAFFTASCESS
jgi:predicted phosphohydrolase